MVKAGLLPVVAKTAAEDNDTSVCVAGRDPGRGEIPMDPRSTWTSDDFPQVRVTKMNLLSHRILAKMNNIHKTLHL